MFRWQNIMRFVNKETLLEEHEKQSRRKATGVDGVTKDEYDVDVHGHIDRLLERMKRFQYRPQPVRRTYIPKANGKLRPLGIPAYEDKLVQGVMANVLSDIYEGVFLDCSYGFRPGRSCHDVVRYQRIAGFLRQACHGAVSGFQHDRAAQHLLRRCLGGRAVLCRFQGESHVPDQRCGIRIAIGGQLKQRHLGRIEHGVHLLEKPVVNSGVVPIQCKSLSHLHSHIVEALLHA